MKTWRIFLILLTTLALVAASCGDDDDDDGATGSDNNSSSDGETELPNTCPAEGCTINFASIEKAGEELTVTWDMNFSPVFAGNHIHIYWDTYQAEEVSGNAADNGFEQGEWVPTDAAPTYTTEGAVSTSVREGSTTLCLVAANGDHNVIDPSAQICQDVSEYL